MAWLALDLSGTAAQAQAPLRLAPIEHIPDRKVGEAVQAMAASGELERLREEITARMIRQAAP